MENHSERIRRALACIVTAEEAVARQELVLSRRSMAGLSTVRTEALLTKMHDALRKLHIQFRRFGTIQEGGSRLRPRRS